MVQVYIVNKFKKIIFNVLVLGQLATPFSVLANDSQLGAHDHQLDDYQIGGDLLPDDDLPLIGGELKIADYQAKNYQTDPGIPVADYQIDSGVQVDSDIYKKGGQLLIHRINDNSDTLNIKWAKGSFSTVSSGGKTFDIKAFSVIKEYENQVFFTQYGLSKDDDSSALNVGLGFYYLISPKIMIDGNVFYDAQTVTDDASTTTENTPKSFSDSIDHRYSVCGTIMTSQAGAFFNIYRGISKGITDYTVAGGLGKYDVSDGYDFGVDGV